MTSWGWVDAEPSVGALYTQERVDTDSGTCARLTGVTLGAPPAPVPFEAMTGDIRSVAETMRMSYFDALEIQRYKWRMSELHLAYVDPDFAGFGAEFSLPFKVWYATASTDLEAVTQAISDAGLSDVVEIRHVPFSDCETLYAHSRAAEVLQAWPHGGRIDILRGMIVFRAADPQSQPLPDPEAMALAERRAAPVPIDWTGDADLYTTQVHGGEPWGGGTAGFVVSDAATLDRGISTAAHITGLPGQYQDVTVGYQGGQYSGSVDAKWYDDYNDTAAWYANYWNGNSVQEVKDRRSRADMGIGDSVCHYGAGTGERRCGVIFSKSEQANMVPGTSATWIGVEPAPGCPPPGCDMGKEGDSGGPWFQSNVAYGLHHGGGANNRAIFMAQNYLSSIGLIVTLHQ